MFTSCLTSLTTEPEKWYISCQTSSSLRREKQKNWFKEKLSCIAKFRQN
jgi:hypothetical protein